MADRLMEEYKNSSNTNRAFKNRIDEQIYNLETHAKELEKELEIQMKKKAAINDHINEIELLRDGISAHIQALKQTQEKSFRG